MLKREDIQNSTAIVKHRQEQLEQLPAKGVYLHKVIDMPEETIVYFGEQMTHSTPIQINDAYSMGNFIVALQDKLLIEDDLGNVSEWDGKYLYYHDDMGEFVYVTPLEVFEMADNEGLLSSAWNKQDAG